MEILEIISNMILLHIVNIWAVKCNLSQSIHIARTWIFQLLKVCFNLENFGLFKSGDWNWATWRYVLSSSFSRSNGQTWSMWFLIHQIYCVDMAHFKDFTYLFSCKCVIIWFIHFNIFYCDMWHNFKISYKLIFLKNNYPTSSILNGHNYDMWHSLW
jgi:hypothetical protein